MITPTISVRQADSAQATENTALFGAGVLRLGFLRVLLSEQLAHLTLEVALLAGDAETDCGVTVEHDIGGIAADVEEAGDVSALVERMDAAEVILLDPM